MGKKLRNIRQIRQYATAFLSSALLSNAVFAKDAEDTNNNYIPDNIDSRISAHFFDNLPIDDGRYFQNVSPVPDKRGRKAYEVRALDAQTYKVFTNQRRITHFIVERTREENKQALERIIQERFFSDQEGLREATDEDMQHYQQQIECLVNNNGMEIIESLNPCSSVLRCGSLTIESLSDFCTIAENGGLDFVWADQPIYSPELVLDLDGLRIDIGTFRNEDVHKLAKLAEDKEFFQTMRALFPQAQFNFSDFSTMYKVSQDSEARQIIIDHGMDIAAAVKQNLNGYTCSSDNLYEMVKFYMNDGLSSLSMLGHVLHLDSYSSRTLDLINRFAQYNGSEVLDYATATLGLKEITQERNLSALVDAAENNGVDVLRVLHDKYGVRQITEEDFIPIAKIGANVGAEKLAALADVVKINPVSKRQLYDFSEMPVDFVTGDIDNILAYGKIPFQYAQKTFGVDALDIEDIGIFGFRVSDEDDVKKFMSPKVRQRYERFKKTFGVEIETLDEPTLRWLLSLGDDFLYNGNDHPIEQLFTRTAAVYHKGKASGLWNDFTFGDIMRLDALAASDTDIIPFVQRIVSETPVKMIRGDEILFLETVLLYKKEADFFGLAPYITRPNVSLSEYLDLIKNKDELLQNGNMALYNKYGITHFERYDHNLLEQIAHDDIADMQRSAAVVIFNKNDRAGAFANDALRQTLTTIAEHQAIAVYETDTDSGMYQAIDEVGSLRKIDLAVVGGHGSPLAINLGYNSCKDHILTVEGLKACGDESYYDITDVDKLKKRVEYFSDDAIIVLCSCSTGSGGISGDNIANPTARALPGRTVIALREPDGGFTVKYKDEKIKGIHLGTEYLPWNNTYAVRFENGALREVDPENL